MTTKGLLVAAIASVAVYGLGDLASGLLYDGYSYKDQWISELSAFGSPVRPLMVTAILTRLTLRRTPQNSRPRACARSK